ncbi:MAG: hypothetical protein AB1813_05440 [Verrucomicrobiota bacterium]
MKTVQKVPVRIPPAICLNLHRMVVLAIGFGIAIQAEPFLPRDKNQVLERTSFSAIDPDAQLIRSLQRELKANPTNESVAAALATKLITRSRRESDPRFLGYAEAALKPWWLSTEVSPAILNLRAAIHQSQHRFDLALIDLDRALVLDPLNAQAWLNRCTILQVQGNYLSAAQATLQLFRCAPELLATACAASIGSLQGQAEKSHELLRRALDRSADAPDDQKQWAWSILADIAVRLGWKEQAEHYFAKARKEFAPDPLLIATEADFWLDQGRPEKVISLFKDQVPSDGLLLRQALAQKALHSGSAVLKGQIRQLHDRFEASRLRGDAVHQREEARFALELQNDPARAFVLASANWEVQREPADARILVEAALAARKWSGAIPVMAWFRTNRVEDVRLNKRIEQIEEHLERP